MCGEAYTFQVPAIEEDLGPHGGEARYLHLRYGEEYENGKTEPSLPAVCGRRRRPSVLMSNSQIVSARCESPRPPIYVWLREPMRVRSGKIHTRKWPERVETPLTSSCTISKWTTTVIGVRNPPKATECECIESQAHASDCRCRQRSSSVSWHALHPGAMTSDCIVFLTPSLPE